MPATPQDRFKAAVARSTAASPFSTTAAEPLILIRRKVRTPLRGCLINHECSAAPFSETGIKPGHTLDVQIPKRLVATKPNHELDALEYMGRRYSFDPVTGDEPHSPNWVIHATSPLK